MSLIGGSLTAKAKGDALTQAVESQRDAVKYQSELERPQVNWYWTEIKKKAKDFAGWNLDLKLNAGYQIDANDASDNGFLIGGTIPLYSKKEKMQQKTDAKAFLHEGAKLCSQLECALRIYLIYQQAYANYEMLAQDEGAGMFEKLIGTQVKLVETEALITQTHRQLQTLLDPYDENPKIFSWDKKASKKKK